MAATEQLFNVRERKRFERHDIWERIAENGTISAAVMVFAAIAAVICANTDAYEAIHHFLETPLYVGLLLHPLGKKLASTTALNKTAVSNWFAWY